MGLPLQTVALLKAARQISKDLCTDAVLLLTETPLQWDEVREHLGTTRLLVAAQDESLLTDLRGREECVLLKLDSPEPMPLHERISAALLKAIANEQLRSGSHVLVLYNGIEFDRQQAEPIDSLSIMHLDEHLETLRPSELRRLDTHVPLETLRLVVDLATEIGREGREGKPVGTIFVVGDTRRVLQMCRPVNFNPFRGYSRTERDLHDRRVREQIKDIAQLDGAIIISRDAIAEAACMYLDAPAEDLTLSKGLASRHIAAAAISRATQAVAIAVSQSSGTVRLFLRGEVVLHIEPLARPHVWQPFRVERPDDDGRSRVEHRLRVPRKTVDSGETT
jgi:DNA integrity scanning protein DisA with diadenylate cyclase activity